MSVARKTDLVELEKRIARSEDPRSLRDQMENASRCGVTAIVEACERRLQQLKAGIYRGAFPVALAEKVRQEPGHCLQVWLPLADDRQGNRRGRVAGEIRVDEKLSITIEDVDKKTLHSSLSNLRAAYEDEGAGSDSWSRFIVASGISIAEYLGVDPADAHESRRSRKR